MGRLMDVKLLGPMSNIVYILVAAAVTNLLRVLPTLVLRKPIRNRFLKSFLYYVPYVTLAVMTVPAIIEATSSPLAGALALVGGIVAAWCGMGLFPVAAVCCALVFLVQIL